MSKSVSRTPAPSPVCCYCQKPQNFPADPHSELRPYGPKGAWLCFGCMTATPEREKDAKETFGALLNAAGPVALIDTRDNFGARPYKKKEENN